MEKSKWCLRCTGGAPVITKEEKTMAVVDRVPVDDVSCSVGSAWRLSLEDGVEGGGGRE